MKARELINWLESHVSKHGDIEVRIDTGAGEDSISSVKVLPHPFGTRDIIVIQSHAVEEGMSMFIVEVYVPDDPMSNAGLPYYLADDGNKAPALASQKKDAKRYATELDAQCDACYIPAKFSHKIVKE